MRSTHASRLSNLPNIGYLTESLLNEVNLQTEQELREVGAVGAWRRLQSRYPERATLAYWFALQGALLGIPGKALPKPLIEQLLDQVQAGS